MILYEILTGAFMSTVTELTPRTAYTLVSQRNQELETENAQLRQELGGATTRAEEAEQQAELKTKKTEAAMAKMRKAVEKAKAMAAMSENKNRELAITVQEQKEGILKYEQVIGERVNSLQGRAEVIEKKQEDQEHYEDGCLVNTIRAVGRAFQTAALAIGDAFLYVGNGIAYTFGCKP